MIVGFDLDFVTFRCRHPKCGEVFEKSPGDLVAADQVFCPRCGAAAPVGEENHALAAASVLADKDRIAKTTT